MPSPKSFPLRNIGPVSAEWLAGVGIRTREDLVRVGAVEAYALVQIQQRGVSLNLLWALAAAERDLDWRELTAEDKAELRERLKALTD